MGPWVVKLAEASGFRTRNPASVCRGLAGEGRGVGAVGFEWDWVRSAKVVRAVKGVDTVVGRVRAVWSEWETLELAGVFRTRREGAVSGGPAREGTGVLGLSIVE